jgi:hypothetical protein
MDTIRQEEIEAIREIAAAENGPVLMVNCNRYRIGEYPDGQLYRRWRTVNQQMLNAVDGKILWTLPVQGQPLINGDLEPLDEILAYWYPSHQAFLDMATSDLKDENMEARKELVEYAIIHRVFGENPPQV